MNSWTRVATRAAFPPGREDRRQPPRGGLGGLGDLEDEDRRHLAALVAAGPVPPVHNRPPPIGPVRCPLQPHFCPFSPRIGDSPPPQKFNTSAPPGCLPA